VGTLTEGIWNATIIDDEYTEITSLLADATLGSEGARLVGHHKDNGNTQSVYDMIDQITPTWLLKDGVITQS